MINEIWSQFEQALSRARAVFVLGHSLNDRLLVRALARHVMLPSRLAIGIHATEDDLGQFDDQAPTPLLQLIGEHLPGTSVVPVRFGPDPVFGRGQLSRWLDQVRTLS